MAYRKVTMFLVTFRAAMSKQVSKKDGRTVLSFTSMELTLLEVTSGDSR